MGLAHRALLEGGRTLAWRAYGLSLKEGVPVLFFHGNLNSRLFAPTWATTNETTAAAGAHVIAVDRPGYGASSYHSNRTYTEFAADIQALTTQLGLKRFAVCGYSSGGPHALAVSALLGDRVTKCALVSSDGPYGAMQQEQEGLITSVYGATVGEALKKPEGASSTQYFQTFLDRAEGAAKDLDQAYSGLKQPKKALAEADLAMATVQGVDAAAQDGILETREWDFEISDVRVPVTLWHGSADTDVPPMVAGYLSDRLAQCTVHLLEGENHSLIRRHWGTILEDVCH